MAKKTNDEKYKLLDEIEHTLLRPSIWIGSTKPNQIEDFILEDEKFVKTSFSYIPAFIKIFDEIVSNSVDESKVNKSLNTIVVTANKLTGEISVYDNGGIPVEINKQTKMYIPVMLFSSLRAGSNFDDTEQRDKAGLNGVGSTLSNIFSLQFKVTTSDGTNQFYQMFSENMRRRTQPLITASKKNFTEISFIPDFSRFSLTGLDDIHLKLLEKRCIDLAACNPNVKISFNGVTYKFKTFKEYIDLYTTDALMEKSEHWEIGFAPSSNGFQQVSFVNSTETKDGGTHVDYITSQVIQELRVLIKKKHKVDIKPSDIKNHLSVFINATIYNPSFKSQTKEELISVSKEFGTSHTVSEKTIKALFQSEVVASILDWIDKKQQAEEKAELRKLNKNLSTAKILKLIDAKSRNERDKCVLGIYEGQSALSAVKIFRVPEFFGAFPLRGKFLNVNELKNSEIIKNEEVVNLMGSLGLRLGEDAFEYHQGRDISIKLLDHAGIIIDNEDELFLNNKWQIAKTIPHISDGLKIKFNDFIHRKRILKNNLRYGKIYIYTDSDQDGNSICALLINFFAKFWPELFEQERIFHVQTPIIVSKKGKDTLSFYNMTDFKKWEDKNLKGWVHEYKKGLAALEDDEYKEIIQHPQLLLLTKDRAFKESLNAWFGGDAILRKERLLKL